MDTFNVPKKVNRHVLSAIQYLSSNKANGEKINNKEVIERVRYQMRNLVPVPSLARVVLKSLNNMSYLSLITREDVHSFSYNCDPRCTFSEILDSNLSAPNNELNGQVNDQLTKVRKQGKHKHYQKRKYGQGIHFRFPGGYSKRYKAASHRRPQKREVPFRPCYCSCIHDFRDLNAKMDSKHNYNTKKRVHSCLSDDSLSGDEIERAQKRARGDFKGFVFKGKKIDIDKVHKHDFGRVVRKLRRKRNRRKKAARDDNENRSNKGSRIINGGGIALATSTELARIPDGIKRLASVRIIKETPPPTCHHSELFAQKKADCSNDAVITISTTVENPQGSETVQMISQEQQTSYTDIEQSKTKEYSDEEMKTN